MTSLLGRLFKPRPESDDSYARAMNVSGDLLARMRETSQSTDAARAVMADIWAQNHNVPFMTTVVETVQEMKSGIEQKPGE